MIQAAEIAEIPGLQMHNVAHLSFCALRLSTYRLKYIFTCFGIRQGSTGRRKIHSCCRSMAGFLLILKKLSSLKET